MPRNFAVFSGGDFEGALRDMTQALTDPEINLAIWNPARFSTLTYTRADIHATAAMERHERKDGIWASDIDFIVTDLPTGFRRKAQRSLTDCPALMDHFNSMAESSEGRVDPARLESWRGSTGRLLDAVNSVFRPDSMELSTRAHKVLWHSRFHVDDGTGNRYVRLLHHLSGRGTFYVDAADVASVSRIPHKPYERAVVELRDGMDTIWETLPGSLALIGGKQTENCIVHSVPFVPSGQERTARCIEIIDVTAPHNIFDAARACQP